MNSKNINSQDSQENSEVRRNTQMPEKIVIAAIQMMYNEHEKDINARGFEKEFPTEKEKNPAEEIYIQAFDSRENKVVLSLSSLNKMEANRNRRMTPSAVRKREKQRNDNSMQK